MESDQQAVSKFGFHSDCYAMSLISECYDLLYISEKITLGTVWRVDLEIG